MLNILLFKLLKCLKIVSSIIYIYKVLEYINVYYFFLLLISNHFLRIYLRYIDLFTSFPAEIPASMLGQGKLLKHWPNISCGILSNFLKQFPQVSFLRFLKSSGNNYPRRYYLGILILGKFRRKIKSFYSVRCENWKEKKKMERNHFQKFHTMCHLKNNVQKITMMSYV